MRVGLLGQLEVVGDDGSPLRLPAARKERAVLSLLALRADKVVRLTEMYAYVWGDDPPRTAYDTVKGYISTVRKTLPRDAIETVPGGYRMKVAADDVDVNRFEQLLGSAGRTMEEGDLRRALDGLKEACALWRGEPLPDLSDQPLGMADAVRFTQMHLTTEERIFEIRLALGDHDALVGDLEAAVAREPLRERRWGQLMLALYRSGRQADALRAFQRLREVLTDELGVEPMAEVRELELAILRQDPQLGFAEAPRATAVVPEPRLPSGNVTFLAAEPEESDELSRSPHGARRAAVDGGRRVLRGAVLAHGGVEVGADATATSFVVFSDAGEAVAACLEAQRRLVCDREAEGAWLGFRMGLHTGLARPSGEGAYGPEAMQEATRICSAAHGGQILLSAETARIVRRDLPDGGSLAARGEFLLSGSEEPEKIFQLVHPDLGSSFPPLHASPAQSHNLPDIRTSFVGRDADLKSIEALVHDHRLVSVVGTGGSGKTRLAIEAAARLAGSFEDGVLLCDLSPIRDGALVPSAMAAALGRRDAVEADPLAAVADTLRGRRVLLVVDNCEHVAASTGTALMSLMPALPDLRVLVTSRRPLGLAGEQVSRLSSLAVPPMDATPEDIAATESVILFESRARVVRPEFRVGERNAVAVATICRQVEGLPLAIELAAAQIGALDPGAISERLRHRNSVLAARFPPVYERHRTLEATVDWSYRLLDPECQHLLRMLSVFANGFTIDAVEVMSDAPDPIDLLTQLVDNSLVVWDPDADRYRLLEPIRTFCQARLEDAGEADLAGARHLSWCAGLANKLRSGSAPADAYELFSRELDNLRVALSWASSHATVDWAALAEAVGAPDPERPAGTRAESAEVVWEAIVSADRAYFGRVDAEDAEFPDSAPERTIPLGGEMVTIGRSSAARGVRPDIDLSSAPSDKWVSREHALLVRQPGGGWAVVDLDSANGTYLNDSAETLPPNRITPLKDGDRLYVGAWTAITLHRRAPRLAS